MKLALCYSLHCAFYRRKTSQTSTKAVRFKIKIFRKQSKTFSHFVCFFLQWQTYKTFTS